MPRDDGQFLHELEVEVAEELRIAQSGDPVDAEASPETWLFDPTDLERNEIGLRDLLGAVRVMEEGGPLDGEGTLGSEPTL